MKPVSWPDPFQNPLCIHISYNLWVLHASHIRFQFVSLYFPVCSFTFCTFFLFFFGFWWGKTTRVRLQYLIPWTAVYLLFWLLPRLLCSVLGCTCSSSRNNCFPWSVLCYSVSFCVRLLMFFSFLFSCLHKDVYPFGLVTHRLLPHLHYKSVAVEQVKNPCGDPVFLSI